MKSHEVESRAAERQPASSPSAVQQRAPRADVDRSPLMQAQRRAIDATLGDARPGNQTGMPDSLKTGIESLSGLDMSAVRVHRNSDKPAQLNAVAYAQGDDIHLAPGQEQHLPHEAWHVVQQRRGRVRPTMQVAGTAVNDDAGLEREADRMGERAVAQRAAAPAKSAEASASASTGAGAVAQREKKTFQSINGDEVTIDTDSPWGNEEELGDLVRWCNAGQVAAPDVVRQELRRLLGLAIAGNKDELFGALHALKAVSGSELLGKATAALQHPNAQAASYDDVESMIAWYDVNHLQGPDRDAVRADMDSVVGGELMVEVPGQSHKNLATRVMARAAYHKQMANEAWADSHPGQGKDPVILYRLFNFGDWGEKQKHADVNGADFGRGIADSWTRDKTFAENWGKGKGHRSIMCLTYDGSVPGYRMSFSAPLAQQLAAVHYDQSKKWNQNELEILIAHGKFNITHDRTEEVEEDGPSGSKEKFNVHYFHATIA